MACCCLVPAATTRDLNVLPPFPRLFFVDSSPMGRTTGTCSGDWNRFCSRWSQSRSPLSWSRTSGCCESSTGERVVVHRECFFLIYGVFHAGWGNVCLPPAGDVLLFGCEPVGCGDGDVPRVPAVPFWVTDLSRPCDVESTLQKHQLMQLCKIATHRNLLTRVRKNKQTNGLYTHTATAT